MEQETILGFDIPVRKLTEEELNRTITKERFDDFHVDAGEDFCDTCGSTINYLILGGFLLNKYPTLSKDLLEVMNSKYGEALGFRDIIDDFCETDQFYVDLAEFINLTEALKGRVNQILIQVDEYYNH